ncbi:IMPACT family protein [Ferruginibacter yonginensis]|uniref:IMPACT family protein n=1 Tax=Ferruginibacter yonginensis TaxID=1310416 RepID=A0ABV8QVT1_9BACT
MSYYNTIEQEAVAEFKDKGSKFIAYAFPFADVGLLKSILSQLKKEHPKAVHFCFAYRIGNDGNTFRSSDDGEPSGSAGKPILGQIDSKEVTDVLVVVVRYFGGTLLGVSGLINAYKSTAAMALQVVPIVRKPVLYYCHIQFDYTQQNDILIILKANSCVIVSQENQLFSTIKVGVPEERKEEVLYRLKNLRNVEVMV